MNCSDRKRSTCLRVTVALVGILAGPEATLFGQVFPATAMYGASGATVDERTTKLGLALDTASIAAEAGMFDLSFEAVKRVCAEGPPIAKPQIQSSLLGGQASALTRVISGRSGPEVPEATVQYSAKLFNIVDKWKSKQAPPERIAEALDQIVFPTGRPNEIMLFSNSPPTNTNSYRYDFSFAKPVVSRYLAFELIELAGKNKKLPSLIEKLEKMRAHPNSQAQAVAMLVYANRASGLADAAAKTLERLLANPVAVDHTMPLYYALTHPVPEVGESSVIPVAASVPLLNKLLKQNVMRMDIRAAILQQLKQAIESDDQPAFDAYVGIVVDSINQMPGFDQNSIKYMLENFYRNLAEECKRQGKAAMAVKISSRAG